MMWWQIPLREHMRTWFPSVRCPPYTGAGNSYMFLVKYSPDESDLCTIHEYRNEACNRGPEGEGLPGNFNITVASHD